MAKGKEFTVTIEDKPGALGKCFLALAQRGINILAFESYVEERAKAWSDSWRMIPPVPTRCWVDYT
jgi:prephenate dehydratase